MAWLQDHHFVNISLECAEVVDSPMENTKMNLDDSNIDNFVRMQCRFFIFYSALYYPQYMRLPKFFAVGYGHLSPPIEAAYVSNAVPVINPSRWLYFSTGWVRSSG
jgi:hypothetical protein